MTPDNDCVLRLERMDRKRTRVIGSEGYLYRTRVPSFCVNSEDSPLAGVLISFRAFNVSYNSCYPRKKHTLVQARATYYFSCLRSCGNYLVVEPSEPTVRLQVGEVQTTP